MALPFVFYPSNRDALLVRVEERSQANVAPLEIAAGDNNLPV